jgi:hypothetical protein
MKTIQSRMGKLLLQIQGILVLYLSSESSSLEGLMMGFLNCSTHTEWEKYLTIGHYNFHIILNSLLTIILSFHAMQMERCR